MQRLVLSWYLSWCQVGTKLVPSWCQVDATVVIKICTWLMSNMEPKLFFAKLGTIKNHIEVEAGIEVGIKLVPKLVPKLVQNHCHSWC